MKGLLTFLVTFSLSKAQPQLLDCCSSSQLRFGGKKQTHKTPNLQKKPHEHRAEQGLSCAVLTGEGEENTFIATVLQLLPGFGGESSKIC